MFYLLLAEAVSCTGNGLLSLLVMSEQEHQSMVLMLRVFVMVKVPG